MKIEAHFDEMVWSDERQRFYWRGEPDFNKLVGDMVGMRPIGSGWTLTVTLKSEGTNEA